MNEKMSLSGTEVIYGSCERKRLVLIHGAEKKGQ